MVRYIYIYIYIIAASIDIAQREVDVYTYGIPRLHWNPMIR